jgi:FkbM family methyltransferase
MKALLIKIHYYLFGIQCRVLKLFFKDYAFFSLTAKTFIISPTIRQLRAADRDLTKRSIKRYGEIFLKLGVDNGLILDIGGNLGYTAIGFRLAIENPNIDIYSFEPYQPNFKFLKKNTLKHNIMFFPFGLGSGSKIMDIGLPDYTYGLKSRDDRSNTGRVSLIGIDNSISEQSSLKAHIVHGDKLLKTMLMSDKVVFIKIDVEGFELDVLNGLSDSIKESMPIIQMEANPITMEMSNTDISSFRAFAISHDYSIYLLSKKGELCYFDIDDILPERVCELFFCHKELNILEMNR